MNKLISFLMVFIFISSNIFSQDIGEVKAKIEKMNKIYTQAMLDNDIETMLSMYSDDIISMPSYQPMVKGLAKIKELSEAQINLGWKTTKFDMTPTDIFIAGNLAIEIGNYDMAMTGPGVPEWKDYGKYMTIWEEQKDGSLKIKVETWNTDTNPWAQMEQTKQEEMKKEK